MKRTGSPAVLALAAACAAVAALALLASPAHAAKCAKPGGGGGCFPTIQQAVDAAGAGETVYVRPGVYKEGVLVVPGKDGLKLVGTGRTPAAVRIEASGLAVAGVVADSANVTVRNLTVRGATAGIVGNQAGTSVSRVSVIGARSDCIALYGGGSTVAASRVKGCFGFGLTIAGADALVRGVSAAQSGGIQVIGARARVIGARVLGSMTTGILVSGVSPLVRGCTVRRTTGVGIQVGGDAVAPAARTVVGNSVLGAVGGGIQSTGAGPAVTAGNVVREVLGLGLLHACAGTCGENRVSANVVSGVLVGGMSLQVAAADAGVLVAGNRASDGGGVGFFLNGPGMEVRDNVSSNCGTQGAPGFFVVGNANLLLRNVSRGSARAGFEVEGDGTTLRKNRAEGNFFHGFIIGSSGAVGTVLDGNRATGNVEYGIFLGPSATGTTVKNNVAVGNSYSPFCDTLNAAVLTANSFTASRCVPP